MSTILINQEEMKQGKDITDFLKALSPQMQERVKAIPHNGHRRKNMIK